MSDAKASTCPRCARVLFKSATGLRCTSWQCNRATPDTRNDGRKLTAALGLAAAVDDLRGVATDAIAHVVSEGRSGDVRAVITSLDHGIARVQHAAEPVRDAVAAWRRPDPDRGTEPTRDVTLTACPRCGVYGCLNACSERAQ